MEQKIGILGAGGWGITLATLLATKNRIWLWEPVENNYRDIRRHGENRACFPGIKIPARVHVTNCLEKAVTGSDILIFVVRSEALRETARRTGKFYNGQPVLAGTKGLEVDTGKSASEILCAELGKNLAYGVLSGPTIARELAQGMPSAAVVAAKSKKTCILFQKLLNCDTLRVYTSDDISGIETAGAFKNVIAIGAGMIDGLGLGINTKASYLTRGLNEMINIGLKTGAREKTFRGLSGIGDLITTAFSVHSRNRSFGEAIIKTGMEKHIEKAKMVIEGIPSTRAFYRLGKTLLVEMPITGSIYRIIYEKAAPEDEIKKLMQRAPREE